MTKGFDLKLKDADVWYYPEFFNKVESKHFYNILLSETNWQQDYITVFGKTYKQPRLTALFGNNNKPYSYSNITMHPQPFTEALLKIKSKIEQTINENFTTCLMNLYRDGQDSNGWHADNEKELGKHPIIASISFGATRMFHLKHRHQPELKHRLNLESGSLLIMKGGTQHHWLHQIPKTKKKVEPRINLTFRILK